MQKPESVFWTWCVSGHREIAGTSKPNRNQSRNQIGESGEQFVSCWIFLREHCYEEDIVKIKARQCLLMLEQCRSNDRKFFLQCCTICPLRCHRTAPLLETRIRGTCHQPHSNTTVWHLFTQCGLQKTRREDINIFSLRKVVQVLI